LSEVPFKNRDAMSGHFEVFKTLLDAEAKRLTLYMDNYDSMIGLCKNATGHLAEEELDELRFDLAKLEDHDDCPNNAWGSV